jgi:hypothetical protein
LKRGNERLNSFIPDGSRVGGGYVVSVVDATLLLLETADLRRRRISTREEGIKLIMTKDVSRWLVEVTHLS